ncbi:energy transducer TonB [Pseudomonas sp.]|uniref:energy transducer TonB n=1 Tax=Pseudomonas sp. TaxID=306 RepID=UPI00263820BF|nr:energy transducer TonB [Pseudomonas sp.]
MTYLNRSRKTLWSVATLITLSVYAGIIAWLLHDAPVATAAAAPAAMMIELAAAPVAQAVEEDLHVAPDKVVQKQVSTPTVQPPKTVVKKVTPTARPTPAKQATSPLKDSAYGRYSSAPDHAPELATAPHKQAQQPAPSATTAPPKLDAQPASTTAASQSSRGTADPAQKVQWRAQLLAHLERFKRYPQNARDRGDRGVAYLRFEIDSNGKVLSASIVRSAGFSDLDSTTLDMIARASPVPRPPEGITLRFTVPVVFAK